MQPCVGHGFSGGAVDGGLAGGFAGERVEGFAELIHKNGKRWEGGLMVVCSSMPLGDEGLVGLVGSW